MTQKLILWNAVIRGEGASVSQSPGEGSPNLDGHQWANTGSLITKEIMCRLRKSQGACPSPSWAPRGLPPAAVCTQKPSWLLFQGRGPSLSPLLQSSWMKSSRLSSLSSAFTLSGHSTLGWRQGKPGGLRQQEGCGNVRSASMAGGGRPGRPTTHKRNVWCFLRTLHLILWATGWTWVILKREIADSDWSVRKSPLSRGPGTGWGWAWENEGATSLVGRGSERSQWPVRLRTGHLLKSTPSGQSFLWDEVPLFPY